MCGIIGYTGKKEATDILIDALELLEYRGYDSAGIALSDEAGGEPRLLKRAGRVKDLRELCAESDVSGKCGIGHTRWATHGGVCDENAHPHRFGRVTIIHNGIIEQFFIYPAIIGESLGLTTLETIIVVLLGGIIAGIPGLIFALPVASVIKYLVPQIYRCWR